MAAWGAGLESLWQSQQLSPNPFRNVKDSEEVERKAEFFHTPRKAQKTAKCKLANQKLLSIPRGCRQKISEDSRSKNHGECDLLEDAGIKKKKMLA